MQNNDFSVIPRVHITRGMVVSLDIKKIEFSIVRSQRKVLSFPSYKQLK